MFVSITFDFLFLGLSPSNEIYVQVLHLPRDSWRGDDAILRAVLVVNLLLLLL